MTPMLLQNKEQSSQSLLALLPDQQATPRMALRVLSRQPPRAASSPTPLPTPHFSSSLGLTLSQPALDVESEDPLTAVMTTSEPLSPHKMRIIITILQDHWEDFRKPSDQGTQPTG